METLTNKDLILKFTQLTNLVQALNKIIADYDYFKLELASQQRKEKEKEKKYLIEINKCTVTFNALKRFNSKYHRWDTKSRHNNFSCPYPNDLNRNNIPEILSGFKDEIVNIDSDLFWVSNIIYNDIANRLYTSDSTLQTSVMKLYNIILEKEYPDIYEANKNLCDRIENYLLNIDLIKDIRQRLPEKHFNLRSLFYLHDYDTIVDDDTYEDYSTKKAELFEIEHLAPYKNKIDMIKYEIINNYISFIPSKYILDVNFHVYAIESLFYNRCNSIGELLNLYENYELHNSININIDSVLNKLGDIDNNIFRSIMLLENIEQGINKLDDTISNMNNSLNEVILSNKNLELSNNRLENQMKSSNSIALKKLEKLSNIESGTLEVAKNLVILKDFSDKVRYEKLREGKIYYYY